MQTVSIDSFFIAPHQLNLHELAYYVQVKTVCMENMH